MVDIHRHKMELASFREHVHPQHAVVLGESASDRNAGLLLSQQFDGVDQRAVRQSVLVRLAQRIARSKRFRPCRRVGFEPQPNGFVEFDVAVRINQPVEVLERQAAQRHLFDHTTLF